MVTQLTIEVARDYRLDKALCTSAFEKLGYDRVLRGHVAIDHSPAGDWRGCFLAMCFGIYGALARLTDTVGQEYGVAKALSLTNEEVWAVVEGFDHLRAEFRVLVEEWLELNVVEVPAEQRLLMAGIIR